MLIGITKGIFFGASIALVSCFKGFHCKSGAQGVGRACTEAFVWSFLSILVIDFILAIIFKAIYEAVWGIKIVVI